MECELASAMWNWEQRALRSLNSFTACLTGLLRLTIGVLLLDMPTEGAVISVVI